MLLLHLFLSQLGGYFLFDILLLAGLGRSSVGPSAVQKVVCVDPVAFDRDRVRFHLHYPASGKDFPHGNISFISGCVGSCLHLHLRFVRQ